MNHTPGPWTFEKENNAHQYIKTPFYIRAGDYLIAVGGLQAENTMGNACLIAAAPELLEALEMISSKGMGGRDLYALIDEMRTIARRAIRKARSE